MSSERGGRNDWAGGIDRVSFQDIDGPSLVTKGEGNNKVATKTRRKEDHTPSPEVSEDEVEAHQGDHPTPEKEVPVLARPPLDKRNRVPAQPQRVGRASQPPLGPFQDIPLGREVGEDGLTLGEVGVEGLRGRREKVVLGEGGVGPRVVAVRRRLGLLWG